MDSHLAWLGTKKPALWHRHKNSYRHAPVGFVVRYFLIGAPLGLALLTHLPCGSGIIRKVQAGVKGISRRFSRNFSLVAQA
jgi:hypothetical protein